MTARLPQDDTICAPATAPGEGAVGIVRVSGPHAVALCAIRFRASSGLDLNVAPSHTVHHGTVVDDHGTRLDEVLTIVMLGPRSYTTEDVVEIQCHGGGSAVSRVMECLLQSGCRMAAPGEFTRRAFLNGRIDLAQAEAVMEVITARTELHQRLAQRQLDGALSTDLDAATEAVRGLAAHMEAAIDFPEEELETDVPQQVLDKLDAAHAQLSQIHRQAQAGNLVRDGVKLAILGRPNVGKSSLLNRLLGYDRAIVADLPGTTRDTVEAELIIDGVRFVVQDTAGIRDSADAVEAQGVARSRQAAAGADLTLMVIDASVPPNAADDALIAELSGPHTVIARNKCDLADTAPTPHGIDVSAHSGAGLTALKQALLGAVHGPNSSPLNHGFLLNLRQRDALRRALDGLSRCRDGMELGQFPELLAADLRDTLDALGEISGETTSDDLLDRVFSQFCIGK